MLLHLDTAAYHGVNEFGSYVWELLASEMTVEDLFDTIGQDVQNAPQTWQSQVRTFLRDLEERNLVTIDDFSPADPHP